MGKIAARLKDILANFSIVDARVAAGPLMPANERVRWAIELSWGGAGRLRAMPQNHADDLKFSAQSHRFAAHR
jgi:hypothetical protein